MRITMQSIHKNILTNLNKITTDMNRINTQISSGKQMSTISDDPVNLVTALGLRSNLTQITTYQNNLKFGNKTITAAENALTHMKDLALRAKTLAIQQVNASVSPENRASAAQEVRHLWEQAIFLGNSEVNGKYVFGGYRTTGYTAAEPAPFIADLVAGYQVNGNSITSTNQMLTGTVDNITITAGDLAINGIPTGADITTGAVTVGLSMEKAFNAKTVIEATDPNTSVKLTTLYTDLAVGADTPDLADTNFDFDLNGVNITVTIPDGTAQGAVATLIANAINAQKSQTGVEAVVGDGLNNGGAASAIVFRNMQKGNDAAITVVVNDPGSPGDATLGFGNFSEAADIDNNTGEISLSSTMSFTLTSPNDPDDAILTNLGLDGGSLGFADMAGDGVLRYGSALTAGDLTINGHPIAATTDDGLSTIYADTSAAAKAKAINDQTDITGVTTSITPAYRTATGAVFPGTLRSGDLVINGEDIFDGVPPTTNPDPATVIFQDTDNTIINAINAKADLTGIVATRNLNGLITLTARDGRNLHIQTSANGENITHLNGAAANTPASTVYSGTIQLTSAHQFFVETTPTGGFEPGLEAIGLGGGSAATGESKDVAGDGQLQVVSIQKSEGNVRYAGDPDHDLAIKVGKESALEVSKNGKSAVSDTGIFSTLKQFENALLGLKFSTVTGAYNATDTTATLDSGNTGLEQQFLSFTNGEISITVTDHSYYPPRNFSMDIGVDTATDSPASIAAKINGIPGMTASFDANGALKLETSDAERYSFTFGDTSNFLELSGITNEQMQIQGIEKAIADLDIVMESMTSQISDFGARANRIIVQEQIYSNLELSTTEHLSEKQDTDLTKALLELKAKDAAYEAALSAAAKTMQLSLVDFLK